MIVKYKLSEKYIIFLKLQLLFLVLILFGGGCAGNQKQLLSSPDETLVWPQSPEKPRIRYIGTISTEADLEKQVSWTQGLGDLLFGKKKMGVLVAPYAIALDRHDRLFVTDTTGGVVHAFNLNTRAYKQFADMPDNMKLSKPVGMTIVDDWIYVTITTCVSSAPSILRTNITNSSPGLTAPSLDSMIVMSIVNCIEPPTPIS